MRNLRLLLILMALSTQLFGQIQIRPLPTPGFEQRISDFVNSLEIVDIHEHLMSEESIKAGSMLDFMLLLHHYADDDEVLYGVSSPLWDYIFGTVPKKKSMKGVEVKKEAA